FRHLPQTTFAYWVSARIRSLFEGSETLGSLADTRRGMATLDDFRFIRLRWEVLPDQASWVTYSKGETYRPFFGTAHKVANWRHDGREVKAYVESKVGSASRKIQAQEWYFRPGLTWIRRTHRLCVRVLPSGAIFSGGAQGIFSQTANHGILLQLLGLMSS